MPRQFDAVWRCPRDGASLRGRMARTVDGYRECPDCRKLFDVREVVPNV